MSRKIATVFTMTKSVRVPVSDWEVLDKFAAAEGISLHRAASLAISEYARQLRPRFPQARTHKEAA